MVASRLVDFTRCSWSSPRASSSPNPHRGIVIAAAKTGDLAVVKVLSEHEKFPVATRAADTKGRTPVAMATSAAVKTAIAEIFGPV